MDLKQQLANMKQKLEKTAQKMASFRGVVMGFAVLAAAGSMTSCGYNNGRLGGSDWGSTQARPLFDWGNSQARPLFDGGRSQARPIYNDGSTQARPTFDGGRSQARKIPNNRSTQARPTFDGGRSQARPNPNNRSTQARRISARLIELTQNDTATQSTSDSKTINMVMTKKSDRTA